MSLGQRAHIHYMHTQRVHTIFIHTYIHSYIHIHMHTYTCTYTHMHIYIHIHIHMHTYIHTYISLFFFFTYTHMRGLSPMTNMEVARGELGRGQPGWPEKSTRGRGHDARG